MRWHETDIKFFTIEPSFDSSIFDEYEIRQHCEEQPKLLTFRSFYSHVSNYKRYWIFNSTENEIAQHNIKMTQFWKKSFLAHMNSTVDIDAMTLMANQVYNGRNPFLVGFNLADKLFEKRLKICEKLGNIRKS